MISILNLWYARAAVLSRIVLVCGLAVVAVLTAGCSGSGRSEEDVVAAFYPLAFAAGQVAPAGLAVDDLTPPGAEPHDLELTARDVERLRDAALVVYAGGGFQPAVEDAVGDRDGTSLDVLESVRPIDGSEGRDPHVWLDPIRYAQVARAIAAALGRRQAAAPLVRRLESLDRDFRRGLTHCARREIVTSHAAFAYLADRYGLEQLPLVGLTPEAEPAAKDLERLVEDVREAGATTVFFEPLVPARLAETVAREAGVSTAVLDPLEGLTSEQRERGEDYFSVMRENLAALRAALGCT
jgi:zinc transport system substrate-binding protein